MQRRYKSLLLTSLALFLSACNNNPDEGNTPGVATSPGVSTPFISGVVADGYIRGAIVCLDKNSNTLCDPGEPATSSQEKGYYRLRNVSAADAAAFPIAVYVPVGAIDEDDPAHPVTLPYYMSAPAGKYGFISPITTMITSFQQVHPDVSLADITRYFVDQMGLDTTANLFENYSKPSASISQKRLHNIARYTAKEYLANNLQELSGAFPSSQTAAVNLLVSNNAANNLGFFSGSITDTFTGTPYTYLIHKAELADLLEFVARIPSKPIPTTNILSQAGGIYRPNGYVLNDCQVYGQPAGCSIPHANSVRYYHGYLTGNIIEGSVFYYDLTNGNSLPKSENDNYRNLQLAETGWQDINSQPILASDLPSSRSYNIAGLGIKPTLSYLDDYLINNNTGSVAFLRFRDAAKFPQGAMAYVSYYPATRNSHYYLYDYTNNNATFEAEPPKSSGFPVTKNSLQDFISFFSMNDLDLFKQSFVSTSPFGQIDNTSRIMRVTARLIPDRSLQLTRAVYDTDTGQTETYSFEGSWEIRQVMGQELLFLKIPSILGDDTKYQTFFTVYQGVVTRGAARYAQDAYNILDLNETAFIAYKAAIKLSNEP